MAQTISRRQFLRRTGTAAAAASLAGAGPLLQGCAAGKAYDLVIVGGLVYDGLGGPATAADLGLVGGMIKAVGRIPASRGKAVIEAKGLAVAPGFIDVHDHTDLSLLADPRAESAVRQGVTTLISGQCGSSLFPLAESVLEEVRSNAKAQYAVEVDWRDLKGLQARLEKGGTAVNFATLSGHGSLRGAAMGFNDRPPQPEEMERMKALLAEDLAAGSFGLSTGLEYTPSGFAAADEIIALCRMVAARGGVYATHMRDEGDRLVEAVEEAIAAARASGASLQISHLKTAFPRNWGKLDEVLGLIERARAEGIDVTADRYPYIAGSTGLDINFPAWARQGTTDEFLARLKDEKLDKRLREYTDERERKLGSWDKVVISGVVGEKNKVYEGLNILQASERAGKQPYEFMRDLIVEERDNVDTVIFMMNEDNLKRILAHPLVLIGSDSSVRATGGILAQGKPHPRGFGTFPRVLGKYVREDKLFSLETAVKKITSAAAAKFKLEGRGIVKPGAFADIVVFDPAAIADKATWEDPHQYPTGISHVLVNGRPVIAEGRHTGAAPGRVLRKGGAA
jgi:N-acyl-D-amino-acid deacylase